MATATIERVQTNGNGKSNGRNGSNGHGSNSHNGSNGNGHSNGKHSRLSPAEVELTVQQWEKKRAAAKAAYEEADRLEVELVVALGVGKSLSLTDGRTLRINDNFIDKTGATKVKAFSVCGIKRFEAEVK